MINPFIRYDQRLEDFVRGYVKNNFPAVNRTGVMSGIIMTHGGLAPSISTTNENSSSTGQPLFVWGTSRWGSNTRVVAG